MSRFHVRQFRDVLKLSDEIKSVRKACKVNMVELSNDINALKAGMQELKKVTLPQLLLYVIMLLDEAKI